MENKCMNFDSICSKANGDLSIFKKIESNFIENIEKSNLYIHKENLLINEIIQRRKQAIHNIIKCFRIFIEIKKNKEEIMKIKINIERNYVILYLQNFIKSFLVKKAVNNLLQKEKEYFCIKCNITNAKQISIKVVLEDESHKILNFEYCKFRKKFVLYILKDIAKQSSFKVNFLVDNKIVIDPFYRTDYDDSGNYYNIIDFNKLEEDEMKQAEERVRVTKFYNSQIARQKELESTYFRKSSFNSSSDDDFDNECNSNINKELSISPKFKKGKWASNKNSLALLSRSIQNFKGKDLKYNKTLNNLISPAKSILKSPGTSKINLPKIKRVSFSHKIEFTV